MKRGIVLAALICLALPIVAGLATEPIQLALQLMHHKEIHFRVIANAGRSTINVAVKGRPDELTFTTTGMCSVLVYNHPNDEATTALYDQATRWDRFGCGGASGTTSVPDAFTYGAIGVDSIRVHNYSGANILVRTWSWRR